jgi:hypothetical protein
VRIDFQAIALRSDLVDGQGLRRLDLFARAANTVRERLGQRPLTFTTEANAIQELRRAWGKLTDATLAVDSAVEPLTFWDLSTRNRVVLTSRSLLEVPSKERFDMPPLTRDEVEAWVKALRGTSTDAAELSRLVTRSSGNPL